VVEVEKKTAKPLSIDEKNQQVKLELQDRIFGREKFQAFDERWGPTGSFVTSLGRGFYSVAPTTAKARLSIVVARVLV
jgi:hypothetical protein